MSTRSRSPYRRPRQTIAIRRLALVAVTAIFLALPALATASYSVNWAKAAQLVNPNKGYALDSVACAPTVTSTAATAGVTTGTVAQ